jgi:hypothetical protein
VALQVGELDRRRTCTWYRQVRLDGERASNHSKFALLLLKERALGQSDPLEFEGHHQRCKHRH